MVGTNALNFLSYGLLTASGWTVLIVVLATTHITVVAVTIYLHRCQAHHALELHPIAAHFFRFWLWVATGVGTRQWAAVHRKHHAKCETRDDPHSPQVRGLFPVLARGAELYSIEATNDETLLRFGHGTPTDWVERALYSRYPNLGVSLLLVLDVALFGAIGVSVWATQMMWIPCLSGLINGLGHFWGYRSFGPLDASRNIFPLGILIGGEELHNNHHAFVTSAKLSRKWYEFDIGWMYICLLAIFGLATVRAMATAPHIVRGRAALDERTLQVILRNKYEVMAKYARTAEHAFRPELWHVTNMSRRERAAFSRALRSWLRDGASEKNSAWLAVPATSYENAPTLHACVELGRDLATIWDRSDQSPEKLLHQLRTWCLRAEASRVDALREYARCLRQFG